ncbi:hypothetical protein [Caudoviricetes sp.]|nr:hypothetical protein [Caudoviricetes sp.]
MMWTEKNRVPFPLLLSEMRTDSVPCVIVVVMCSWEVMYPSYTY